MKRYKLIQEYPGSFPKGTIVYHPHQNKWGGVENDYKIKNPDRYTDVQIYYSKDYIENYPKFWKKLK